MGFKMSKKLFQFLLSRSARDLQNIFLLFCLFSGVNLRFLVGSTEYLLARL